MIELRPARTDEDLATVAGIVSKTTPENPISVEEMRWADATYPGGRRFVALLDGVPAGAGGAGRVHVYPPEYEGLWGNISVLEGRRRQGVGSVLLQALSDVARDAGKTLLLGRTTAAHPEAIEFLEHRGFREVERMKVVRLDLSRVDAAAIDAAAARIPPGIRMTSLGDEPELARGAYDVALEALPDIPGEGPQAPGSYEEFRARDVDRPGMPPGGFVLGVEESSGRVVGYASLMITPGSPTVAWHHMTGVARDWRGRGLAGALKAATIRWALGAGIDALETANDVVNAPMREVNRKLGYLPEPDEIIVRGPILPPATEARVPGPPGTVSRTGA